ncbi:GNAT family N-acetyltransferase [Kineococcus terrestris]|uniref:GNAT family N-acetyltransferase n=1 Tax=Kineococcus terrestris TaxID=2044856 RepID=UPI0034DB375C
MTDALADPCSPQPVLARERDARPAGALPVPRPAAAATGTTTGTTGTSGLALVTDPAEGLRVTVRRELSTAPVPEWRALAAAAGAPPFCGPDWLRAVHTHLGSGDPLLVSVRRQGRLLAFGAFAVLPATGASRPVVTSLGAGVSDYTTVLADPDAEVPAARLVAAVLDAVAGAVPGAVLDLEQVPADDPLLEPLALWARARDHSVRLVPQAVVHAVPLPATVAEHDAALGRRVRHEERRQWRRLAAAGRLEVVDDLLARALAPAAGEPAAEAAAVAALVEELAAVDAAHPRAAARRRPWRGASGRTLADVLREAPRPVVQLSGLRVDGELAAYTLCFAGPRALHGYLQSYRARWAPYGPGTLLLLRVRRRAVLSGYRELDLLRGEEAYKRRMERTTRRTVRVVAVPLSRGLVPGLVDRAAVLRRTYRDELRRHERLAAAADAAGSARDAAASAAARARDLLRATAGRAGGTGAARGRARDGARALAPLRRALRRG